jgi:hypothetical protein
MIEKMDHQDMIQDTLQPFKEKGFIPPAARQYLNQLKNQF